MKPERPLVLKARVVIIAGENLLPSKQAASEKDHQSYQIINQYKDITTGIMNLRKDRPEIIVLEVDSKEKVPGIGKIKQRSSARMLIVANNASESLVIESFRFGASGYITKPISEQAIYNSLDDLLAGGNPVTPEVVQILIGRLRINPTSPLTKRETEIIRELAQCKTYTEIAEQLVISKDTVRAHLRNIYLKLEANSKSQAIRIAERNRYI